MHEKVDLISFMNTPQRLERIANLAVDLKHFYVEPEVPFFCIECSEPIGGNAVEIQKIYDNIASSMARIPQNLPSKAYVELIKAACRLKLKESLMHCRMFFADEIPDSSISHPLSDGEIISSVQHNSLITIGVLKPVEN